jgi:hypothetical protein
MSQALTVRVWVALLHMVEEVHHLWLCGCVWTSIVRGCVAGCCSRPHTGTMTTLIKAAHGSSYLNNYGLEPQPACNILHMTC